MNVIQEYLPSNPVKGDQYTSDNTGITYEFSGHKWVPIPLNKKHKVDEEVTLICS